MPPPGTDAAARQKVYDDFHLSCETRDVGLALPWMHVVGSSRWKRADGTYTDGQVAEVMSSYPETKQLSHVTFPWARLGLLAGLDLGMVAGVIPALVSPAAPLYEIFGVTDGMGALVPLVEPDPARPGRLRDAYNCALARDLGLEPPPDEAAPAPRLAGAGWLAGSLCLDGFLGMSVQAHGDLDRFYPGVIRWAHARIGPSLVGGAVDYAFTDHVQIGLVWEPSLPKRSTVSYADGHEDVWTLDAAGVLGRARVFLPLSPSLGLVVSAGLGQYTLSGAKLVTDYWYGSSPLTGNGLGGMIGLGFERLETRMSGVYTGIGYRFARITPVTGDPSARFAARDPFTFVDHSGLFFETSWRFYWGVARGAPASDAPSPALTAPVMSSSPAGRLPVASWPATGIAAGSDHPWGLATWGGYSKASLEGANGAVERNVDGLIDATRSSFGAAGIPVAIAKDAVVRLSGGIAGGVEGCYAVSPTIALCARTGYLAAGQAASGFTATMIDATSGDTYRLLASERLSASLVPVFVGVRGRRPVSDRVSIHGGVFAGMGFARGEDSISMEGRGTGALAAADATFAGTVPLAGSGIGGEVLVGAAGQLMPGVSLGIDLGYRFMKIAGLEATRSVDLDSDGVADARTGDQYQDFSDKVVPFDFSGLTATASLTVRR